MVTMETPPILRSPTDNDMDAVEVWLAAHKARRALGAARAALNELANIAYDHGCNMTSEAASEINERLMVEAVNRLDSDVMTCEAIRTVQVNADQPF